MDKYSFIVINKELEGFLIKLQELGMVDINRSSKPVDDFSTELLQKSKKIQEVIKKLESFHNESESPSNFDLSNLNGDLFLNEAITLLERRDLLISEIENLKREHNESALWGDFDNSDISKIEALGITLHFYSIFKRSFNESWKEEYPIQILNQTEDKIYFTIASENEAEFNFSLVESKFPHRSFSEIENLLVEDERNLNEVTFKLLELKKSTIILKTLDSEVMNNLELYLAGTGSVKEAEDSLAILTGFSPAEQKNNISNFLSEESVYFHVENAVEEDNPPIKLKNNFFTRLFEPIADLYMLPKYGELDLTPYFAPFYMLFFGLCFGDMGYGLLLLFGGGLAKYKLKEYKGYLTLIQFLGFGAVLMASLSGTFFGAKIYDIFTFPKSINEFFLSDLEMFWFAIIFGIIQIVFARLLNAIDNIIRRGWKYGMANIGWSLAIIWGSFVYASTMNPSMIIPSWFNYVFGIGGLVLIVLFSSTEGNIIIRVLKGAFSMYDVTGVFGDMLSYIRLFGLGTAGGILGFVVNSVSIDLAGVPYVGWFFSGLMLLLGHTLVLGLSSLGAFVHPMRLTFVEFYKNSGFTGGGRAFRPLTNKK